MASLNERRPSFESELVGLCVSGSSPVVAAFVDDGDCPSTMNAPDGDGGSTPMERSGSTLMVDGDCRTDDDEDSSGDDGALRSGLAVAGLAVDDESGATGSAANGHRIFPSRLGPRCKLIHEGDIQLCRLNHTRTIISKIMNSKYLRRWEAHRIVLGVSEIVSATVEPSCWNYLAIYFHLNLKQHFQQFS